MRCHSYHNSYNWEGIAILLRNSKTVVFTEAGLSLLLLLSVVTTNIGHAQLSNRTQLWTDPENDVEILFTYSPKNPSIDKPTELSVGFIASEMQKEGLDPNNEENLDSYLNTKFM